jgi:hypothetical protein
MKSQKPNAKSEKTKKSSVSAKTADHIAPPVTTVDAVMPPPEALLREAVEEPNHRDLADYVHVIATLRGKGFTYRNIAEWLTERGVEADHNAVYRVYTNTMSDEQAAEESRRDDEEAEMEAMRNQ